MFMFHSDRSSLCNISLPGDTFNHSREILIKHNFTTDQQQKLFSV